MIGDAGELPSTAQGTGPALPLTLITGTLAGGADMYAILITDFASFSAAGVSSFDSQLFLFDSGGNGVYSNDDTGGAGTPGTLPSGHPFGPTHNGLYYLAFSAFNYDPISSGGRIFPDFLVVPGSLGIYGPTGPGGGSAITGWTDPNSASGAYSIVLTGALPIAMLMWQVSQKRNAGPPGTASRGDSRAMPSNPVPC